MVLVLSLSAVISLQAQARVLLGTARETEPRVLRDERNHSVLVVCPGWVSLLSRDYFGPYGHTAGTFSPVEDVLAPGLHCDCSS